MMGGVGSTSAGYSVVFVVVSISLWPLATAQQQATPPANITCSVRFFVSVNDATAVTTCQGSCLQSSPSLPQQVGGCISFMNILELHNGNVGAGDCLELLLAPGSYLLPSLDRVRVQSYSLIMSAPEGGVTFSCVEESGCEEDGIIGGGASGEVGTAMAMMVFDGAENSDMFVTIEGILFRSCSRRLQFDDVSYVGIRNCSFM